MKLIFSDAENDCVVMDVETELTDIVKPDELGIEFPHTIRPMYDDDGILMLSARDREAFFRVSIPAKYAELNGKAAAKRMVEMDA